MACTTTAQKNKAAQQVVSDIIRNYYARYVVCNFRGNIPPAAANSLAKSINVYVNSDAQLRAIIVAAGNMLCNGKPITDTFYLANVGQAIDRIAFNAKKKNVCTSPKGGGGGPFDASNLFGMGPNGIYVAMGVGALLLMMMMKR
jgi:hypothetical protein